MSTARFRGSGLRAVVELLCGAAATHLSFDVLNSLLAEKQSSYTLRTVVQRLRLRSPQSPTTTPEILSALQPCLMREYRECTHPLYTRLIPLPMSLSSSLRSKYTAFRNQRILCKTHLKAQTIGRGVLAGHTVVCLVSEHYKISMPHNNN